MGCIIRKLLVYYKWTINKLLKVNNFLFFISFLLFLDYQRHLGGNLQSKTKKSNKISFLVVLGSVLLK